MFTGGNAASANRNVALFTVELALFGGVGWTLRIIEGGQELLKWNHGMNFRFIREMFCYTVSTQMCMTNITVQRGHGIPTHGTPHNVLGATSGVHGQGWAVPCGWDSTNKTVRAYFVIGHKKGNKILESYIRGVYGKFSSLRRLQTSKFGIAGPRLYEYTDLPGLISKVFNVKENTKQT